jgi:preprotein translocase subunit SecB
MNITKSDFQLTRQRLISVSYEHNPKFEAKGSVDLDMDVQLQHSPVEGKPAARLIMIFSIFKESPLEAVPFKISATIQGDFSWAESVPPEDVQKLLAVNAPTVLMAYIRPIISQLTVFSGIPALVVPLINFAAQPSS